MPESDSRPAQIIDENQFLELCSVDVARGDRVVLHDVNLTIRAGEHVAILGPNGCGISTLILAMTCQIYPMVMPGMRVRIFGRERWDLTQLRKHFGVVAVARLRPWSASRPRISLTSSLAKCPQEKSAVSSSRVHSSIVPASFVSTSLRMPSTLPRSAIS